MPVYALGDLRPTIDDTCWVAPDAHVIGRVSLESEVGVWFGAVLRGDNEPIAVGSGSNIQEGVMGHTDPGFPLTIGRNCTIGHHAIVHGCTIEDDVLIGMGAVVMNGAVIGSGSVVGAGALVTERKTFPPGSLIVGSPARAIRTLDDASRNALRASAAHYISAAHRFKRDLKPIG